MSAPLPGSPEAVAQGCTCPVWDNGHGKGAARDGTGTTMFWIEQGCPVHDPVLTLDDLPLLDSVEEEKDPQ